MPFWIAAVAFALFASVLVCHDDEFTSPQKWITRAAPAFRSRAARAAFFSRIGYHPQFANLHKFLSQKEIPGALTRCRSKTPGTIFYKLCGLAAFGFAGYYCRERSIGTPPIRCIIAPGSGDSRNKNMGLLS